jgi:hypothetical protein
MPYNAKHLGGKTLRSGHAGGILSITGSFLLWVHLLAYNLIRLLMAQAALDADVQPRQLSFKHTVQLWVEWTAHRVNLSADPDTLFRLIAQPTVGNRPGRIEPRARKRRPKPYPWLKRPRAEARERVRRYGHL